MKKRLIGIFDSKQITPEEIYEKVIKSLKKKEKVVIKKDLDKK